MVSTPINVRGRLATLSSNRQSEHEQAGQMVEGVEAVAHVDVGTLVAGSPVDNRCQIQRVDAPAPLAGLWDVAVVRYVDAHLRLLLRRPEKVRGRS